jgi:phosphatidate cytidylyltransferase
MIGVRGKFADLAQRSASAVALAVVGVVADWYGGTLFLGLVAVIVGLMLWELARMLDPGSTRGHPWRPERITEAPMVGLPRLGAAVALALLAALALGAQPYLPQALGLAALALPSLAGLVLLARRRGLFALAALGMMLAGASLFALRAGHGPWWLLWLVLVVIATDVFGYFAGRTFGGPKFWPRVSPNKTWSGTVAGWVTAALAGAAFALVAGAGVAAIAGLSVLVSMAAQAGDIAESKLKRLSGVKDSSNLLPGHGGVMDRFDGMMGAGLFLWLVQIVTDFPPDLAP